jgi:Domain of unknown function (DUF4403)
VKRLGLVVLLLAACSTPPQPVSVPATPVTAAAEVSTLVVPIRASLAPLLPMIESQVPKSFLKTDDYELDPQHRFGMKYKVVRDPIALKMQGAGLHASTTVHYALEGCKRTKNPVNGTYSMWPCISCGFAEPMRDAAIELQSRLDWGSDWTLRSTTTARPVLFPNRCAVTLFNIDITDWKLAPLVQEQLQAVAKTIDRNTPKLAVIRPAARQIWSSLQMPFEIAPRTWLVLDPIDVGLAPIRGSGVEVASALTLHARTRVVIGQKPATTTRSLPPLKSAEPNGSGVRVPFDLEIPYDEASRLLTEQFAGHVYQTGSSSVAVESIRLSPGSNGHINIEAAIDFRGGGLRRYHGLVYLDGVPAFDAPASSVVIEGLRYRLDPKRKNPFLRTFDRMAHDEVEERLGAGAKWSLAPQLADMRAEVERGLTRQLTAGVLLRGRVDSIQLVAIVPAPTAITIRIIVTGSAEVEVKEWR